MIDNRTDKQLKENITVVMNNPLIKKKSQKFWED